MNDIKSGPYPTGSSSGGTIPSDVSHMLNICRVPNFHLPFLHNYNNTSLSNLAQNTHKNRKINRLGGVHGKVTKYLGNVFETFVDPFHLGCHEGISQSQWCLIRMTKSGSKDQMFFQEQMVLPVTKWVHWNEMEVICDIYKCSFKKRGRVSAKASLHVI